MHYADDIKEVVTTHLLIVFNCVLVASSLCSSIKDILALQICFLERKKNVE